MIEQQLEDDLKTAMLAGDGQRVQTLRMLKSALLNKKIAEGSRDSEMSDNDVIGVLAKEAKKRQESADMYGQGGRPEMATTELAEKALIDGYLPQQLSGEELGALIDEVINISGASSEKDMGMVIGQVRSKAGPVADGALIARLVKERLGE